ncbi:hypothetical protein AB0N81_26215 [Streptomyces sp. NPDC093510]|uniref:hypothetical protein n=1 Tax=Streptomyces sp. NPDC093510 TaxID=3155199 RepID=UPI003436D07C
MTNTKRVLAAVALTGAALSFSGAAQAQETNPVPVGDVTNDGADVVAGLVPVVEKQTQDVLRALGR